MLRITVTSVLIAGLMGLLAPTSALAQSASLFVPIEPCRLVDTRQVGGAFGSGATRNFYVWGINLDEAQGGASDCGVSSTASAVHVNFTAVNPTGRGYLRAWPYGATPPTATLLNFFAGPGGYSNATALAICQGECLFDITVRIFNRVSDLVIDVVGYYEPNILNAPAAEQQR